MADFPKPASPSPQLWTHCSLSLPTWPRIVGRFLSSGIILWFMDLPQKSQSCCLPSSKILSIFSKDPKRLFMQHLYFYCPLLWSHKQAVFQDGGLATAGFCPSPHFSMVFPGAPHPHPFPLVAPGDMARILNQGRPSLKKWVFLQQRSLLSLCRGDPCPVGPFNEIIMV